MLTVRNNSLFYPFDFGFKEYQLHELYSVQELQDALTKAKALEEQHKKANVQAKLDKIARLEKELELLKSKV